MYGHNCCCYICIFFFSETWWPYTCVCVCFCRSVTCLLATDCLKLACLAALGFGSFGIWRDYKTAALMLVGVISVLKRLRRVSSHLHTHTKNTRQAYTYIHTYKRFAVPSESRTTCCLYYNTTLLFCKTDVTPALCIISKKRLLHFIQNMCALHNTKGIGDVIFFYD